MAQLILDSLEVQNFRAFQQLQLENLSRVNLFVGKNQVGKTSLLEALWLYARRGDPLLIWQLLSARDESPRFGEVGRTDQIQAIRHLFHKRKAVHQQLEPIQIGSLTSPTNALSISVGWYSHEMDETGRRTLQPLAPDELREHHAALNPILAMAVQVASNPPVVYRHLRPVHDLYWSQAEHNEINCIFISANGSDKTEIIQLWDRIALTNREEEVMTALRIIAPQIERLNLVGTLNGKEERIPMVKLEGEDEPVPLRSLGDGITRLFGMALALVNAKDGILLIDEIENGLHYSMQPEIWHFIFRMASRLNVQFFATTHSWDTIEAFQQAAQNQADGLLIRLQARHSNRVIPTIFDQRKVAIATREYIEVR